MEIKRIGIYPFNDECMVFLEYSNLLNSEYRICEAASLNGWGFVGRNIKLESDNYQIKASPELFNNKIDILFVPEFDASESVEEFIVNEIIGMVPEVSEIMCAANLSEAGVNKIRQACGDQNLNCKFLKLAEKALSDDITAIYNDGRKNLEKIDVPIIVIAGLWENTDKFKTSLVLRNKLLKEGYRVSQIGSRNYCELFGFHSFPGFMTDSKISEIDKPLMLNRYVKKIADCEESDVIIIGIPGSIQSFNEKYTNRFGILPYITFQALLVDFLIMCTFYEYSSVKFLDEISQLCKYRFSCCVDAYHMSNLYIDLAETEEKNKVITNRIPRNIINKTLKDNYGESKIPVFNLYEDRDVDRLFDLILNKLSGDVKIMV